MNKILKYILAISSGIGVASLVLALVGIYEKVMISDQVILTAVIVFLIMAAICMICTVIRMIHLLIQGKVQQHLKQNWKKMIVEWMVIGIILCVIKIVQNGFD
ncbi:MAG: hypothetical protein Q4E73_11370, partial [Lachnospiraceae bacterium]|nr:hypothetical protein [Lachnospiraceae bacterium]